MVVELLEGKGRSRYFRVVNEERYSAIIGDDFPTIGTMMKQLLMHCKEISENEFKSGELIPVRTKMSGDAGYIEYRFKQKGSDL